MDGLRKRLGIWTAILLLQSAACADAGGDRSVTNVVDGSVYEGTTVTGWYGSGTITYANGEIYRGDVVSGMRHGRGRHIDAQGNARSGTWHRDIYVGPDVQHETMTEHPGSWTGRLIVLLLIGSAVTVALLMSRSRRRPRRDRTDPS